MFTHFHRGEVVFYEDKCPDYECNPDADTDTEENPNIILGDG